MMAYYRHQYGETAADMTDDQFMEVMCQVISEHIKERDKKEVSA